MTGNLEWVNVYVGCDYEGYLIAGIPLRQYEQRSAGEIVTLEHRPDDSRPTEFSVFEICTEGDTLRLACCEILNNVYSLYVFMEKPERFKETKRAEAIKTYLAKRS